MHGKTVILSIMDRFSKYCHFVPLAHPYTVESVAQAFFTDIVRLHGIPQSIVSDRDPVFTSVFWHELLRLMGTKLHMSSAFHPQTDGQTEATNRVIIMYLWCFPGIDPDNGCAGCRGLSTSTTPHTSPHSMRHHSRWSTDATRPPSAPTSPVRLVWQLFA